MSRRVSRWRSGKGKSRLVAVLVALPLVGLVPVARAVDVSASDKSPALCGAKDTPETGIQGDMPRVDQETRRASHGYNCGLMVVGHNDLGGLGGGAIAWAGHCAFMTTGYGSGIEVIDMTDPTDPQIVKGADLPTFGSSEQMQAVVKADGRAVLAYGRGIYDVTECTRAWTKNAPVDVAKLRVLGDLTYTDKPIGSPHNIKLSPDGTKMVGTMPLSIADISNLDDKTTWSVKYFQCEVAKQTDPAVTSPNPVVTSSANYCDVVQPSTVFALTMPRPQLAHEPEFNADGTRLYIGGQRQSDPFGQDVTVDGVTVFKRDEYMHVLDMTVWPPKALSEAFGPGHGMQSITIGGQHYLMHSNEGGTPGAECKPAGSPNMGIADQNAQIYLTKLDGDTLAPEPVSSIRLAINTPEPRYCAAQVDSNLGPTCRMAGSAASRGCVSTVHYHQVDNPANATFAMLSMTSAGLRISDIRDPVHPHEVAYWSSGQVDNTHGCASLWVTAGMGVTPSACGLAAMQGTTVFDRVWQYAHYDAATGYIWVGTSESGFWVLKLEPQVRDALGLPHIEYPQQPDSAPAKPES